MLGGEVEVDETYIGGKVRNMHRERRDRVMDGKKAGPVKRREVHRNGDAGAWRQGSRYCRS